MKPSHPLTSACRYCRYYQPQGRRGGMCHQLSAPVQSGWKACALAIPAFAPSWESLEDAWTLPVAQPIVPVTANLNSERESFVPIPVEETSTCVLSEVKTKALVI
jgi:hypothetical protein